LTPTARELFFDVLDVEQFFSRSDPAHLFDPAHPLLKRVARARIAADCF
jgi:hypothetical protein